MDILYPSLKERLWHRMQQDIANYRPDVTRTNRLMCCACGRFLPPEHFSIDHIIPQQIVARDPPEAKQQFTNNQRSLTTLLCTKPLKIKGQQIYRHGCNSWKGKFYDTALREVLEGKIKPHNIRRPTTQHTIAALCVAYLILVSRYGYQIALTESGMLMRRQFFMPRLFHGLMPLRSQMILVGDPPDFNETMKKFWGDPVSFDFELGFCTMAVRNLSLAIPIARDPRVPVSKLIVIRQSQFSFKPDFRTMFD